MLDQSELVRAAYALDPLPASVSRLATLVARENWSVKEAEDVIALDQALTVKILRLANSAAGGSRLKIATVGDALVRLGVGVVLSMATGSSVQRLIRVGLPERAVSTPLRQPDSTFTELLHAGDEHDRAIVTDGL